jgi:hypothetical protein
MATQDERITALERAQIANNEQFTMLLGVIGEQGRDIKRIATTLEQHTALLTQHTALLQQILQKLDERK